MGSLSAATVLDGLAELGCAVRVEGEKLKVRGPNRPEVVALVAELRSHREEAIPLVRKLNERYPPADPLPLGRMNAECQMVLRTEDLDEFAKRLRSYGWNVKRRGDELDCAPPSPRPKREAKRKGGLRLSSRPLGMSLPRQFFPCDPATPARALRSG
jgi:hypothetical protein